VLKGVSKDFQKTELILHEHIVTQLWREDPRSAIQRLWTVKMEMGSIFDPSSYAKLVKDVLLSLVKDRSVVNPF
jgi:hypothetical protein